MKIRSILLVAFASFVCATTSKANVTNVVWNSGTSGLIYWNVGTPSDITGVGWNGSQGGSAQMSMTLVTDNTDPTFTLTGDIINTSGFTWTSYIIDVSMTTTFSVGGAAVLIPGPGNWSTSVGPLTGPVLGFYSDQIVFSAGTPVVNGAEFKYTYDVTFSGGPSFTLNQTTTPVPEPGTASLLFAGSLLLGGLKVARQRRNLSGKN